VTTRRDFLATVRQRLARGAPDNIPLPLVPVATIPRVRFPDERTFESMSAVMSAPVSRDLDALLTEAVSATSARTVVCSRDPETASARPALAQLGVEVLDWTGFDVAARADLGVVGAAWAIASTGTLVFYADRAAGRSASLLPPAMVAIVREENVLPDAAALFRERMPDPMPSQIVLSTGPSRSADIELTLTVGVHGPGRVWVCVVT
jgi:L-lactate utilization protein LutC